MVKILIYNMKKLLLLLIIPLLSFGQISFEETSSCKHEGVELNFSQIKMTDKFYFDRKNGQATYNMATRDGSWLIADLKVTSESHNPKLPLISLYKLQNNKLDKIDAGVYYEFYSIDDDFKNDFSYTETVHFSIGSNIIYNDTDINGRPYNFYDYPVFLVVRKNNCVTKDGNGYRNSPCDYEWTMDLETLQKEYFIIKIFNKEKL